MTTNTEPATQQNDQEIILYSTEGCHLCEQAYVMLASVSMKPKIIDIVHDEALFLRYGVTIPVLSFNGNELNWPFNMEQLQLWLTNNGITYHT